MNEPTHKIRHSWEIQRKGVKGPWFVWECICGESGPLCDTVSRARETYAEHKATASPVLQTTKGTEQ